MPTACGTCDCSLVLHVSFFFPTLPPPSTLFFFFFNDTATTEIYTLSLHDALPISPPPRVTYSLQATCARPATARRRRVARTRSEEHTSELQSLAYLVCRLLLEKKKKKHTRIYRRSENKILM